jgi:copper(I)-binding protein
MKSLVTAAFVSILALGACSKAPESAVENPPPAPAPISNSVSVTEPWAAITPAGAKVGAGYFTVTNPGVTADKLIGAASPRAKTVELHEMKMDGAMMSMRPVPGGVEVPASGTVKFAPGGYHLMFMDIDAPFTDGQEIPVTLTFEKAGAVEVTLKVAAAGTSGDMKMEGH